MDYKASARRKSGANIELSDAVKHPSAVSVDAKKSLKSDRGIHGGTCKSVVPARDGGAMVARLTLDQKVACSNPVGVIC